MQTPPLPEFDDVSLSLAHFEFGLHWVFGGLLFVIMIFVGLMLVVSVGF